MILHYAVVKHTNPSYFCFVDAFGRRHAGVMGKASLLDSLICIFTGNQVANFHVTCIPFMSGNSHYWQSIAGKYVYTARFSFDWISSSLEFETISLSSLGYKGVWDFFADWDESSSESYIGNLDRGVLYMDRGGHEMVRKCPTLLTGQSISRTSWNSRSRPCFCWMYESQYELGEKASFWVLSSALWPWTLCLCLNMVFTLIAF